MGAFAICHPLMLKFGYPGRPERLKPGISADGGPDWNRPTAAMGLPLIRKKSRPRKSRSKSPISTPRSFAEQTATILRLRCREAAAGRRGRVAKARKPICGKGQYQRSRRQPPSSISGQTGSQSSPSHELILSGTTLVIKVCSELLNYIIVIHVLMW